MRIRPSLALVALAALACTPSPPAATTTTTTTTHHREAARTVLEEHCGLCHLPPSASPDASGMALHIYDLTQDDWSATLSEQQLPVLVQKLVDDGASDAEVRVLEDFVRAELAWRAVHPPPG